MKYFTPNNFMKFYITSDGRRLCCQCSDVYPFLRLLCRKLGLEFGAVDMRWGVSEETTREHRTLDMCICEVSR